LRTQSDIVRDTVNAWLESVPLSDAEHVEARSDLHRLVASAA
jgi:hypothetical protein